MLARDSSKRLEQFCELSQSGGDRRLSVISLHCFGCESLFAKGFAANFCQGIFRRIDRAPIVGAKSQE
jgi:hypothetical protein